MNELLAAGLITFIIVGMAAVILFCVENRFDFRKVKPGQIWRYTYWYNPFESESCRRVVLGVKNGYVRYETLGRGGIAVMTIRSFRRNSKLEVEQ